DALARELEHRFVGQRAGARDDADVALLVNVAGRDADAAAAAGILAGAGGDEAGAVRADEASAFAGHRAFHANHVLDRNALGDRDGEIKVGGDRFERRVAGERRRDEDRGDGGAGRGGGFGDGIENRHAMRTVFEELSAFAGRDASDELRAVVEREPRVTRAEFAGDALNEDL